MLLLVVPYVVIQGQEMKIKTSISALGLSKAKQLRQQSFTREYRHAGRSRSIWKSTTLASYIGAFLFILTVVAIGYEPPKQGLTDSVANAVATPSITPDQNEAAAPSVDQLIATRVAAGIAERAELPIARNVANLSLSLSVVSELAQVENNVITKPQIIQPEVGSREILTYTTVSGDTVAKLAAQFNISEDTIRWANNLTSDLLEPGKEMQIPPVNGVVYTVKEGDTTAAIAQRYSVDERRMILFNNLENGITAGQKILLLDGDLPETERPGYVAPRPVVNYSGQGTFGGIVYGNYRSGSVGNRYAWGNCTYYAYERRAAIGRPVGSFWGNAATWAAAAAASGYVVNNTPAPGAVAHWNAYSDPWVGYYGHVGIVESVNEDGTVTISEMNNGAYGGFNIVNRRTIPAGAVSNYIH